MNKKTVTLNFLLLMMAFFFLSSPIKKFVNIDLVQLKNSDSLIQKTKNDLKEKEVFNNVRETKNENLVKESAQLLKLSNESLRSKLELIEASLKLNEHKEYSDFTKEELEKYNLQVQESVRIKKAMFFKKYANRNDI